MQRPALLLVAATVCGRRTQSRCMLHSRLLWFAVSCDDKGRGRFCRIQRSEPAPSGSLTRIGARPGRPGVYDRFTRSEVEAVPMLGTSSVEFAAHPGFKILLSLASWSFASSMSLCCQPHLAVKRGLRQLLPATAAPTFASMRPQALSIDRGHPPTADQVGS